MLRRVLQDFCRFSGIHCGTDEGRSCQGTGGSGVAGFVGNNDISSGLLILLTLYKEL